MLGDGAELLPPAAEQTFMGMPRPDESRRWTAVMVQALPADGKRYEVVHGELLVTPAPRPWHQEIVARLQETLRAYLRREPVGVCLPSPADLILDDMTLVQPDLFVVDPVEARTWAWEEFRTFLLVAEVTSPSTAARDRGVKRRRYQQHGVATYWVVDPEARLVEVWRPADEAPAVERQRLVWHPVGAGEAMVVDLEELFREE